MGNKQVFIRLLFVVGVITLSNAYGGKWFMFGGGMVESSDSSLFFLEPSDLPAAQFINANSVGADIVPMNITQLDTPIVRSSKFRAGESRTLNGKMQIGMKINRAMLKSHQYFQGSGRIIIRAHGLIEETGEGGVVNGEEIFFPSEDGTQKIIIKAEALGKQLAKFLNDNYRGDVKEVYLDWSRAEHGTGERFTQSFFEQFKDGGNTIVTYRNMGGRGYTEVTDGKLTWRFEEIEGSRIDKGQFYATGEIPEEYKHIFVSKKADGTEVDRDHWLSSRRGGACANP